MAPGNDVGDKDIEVLLDILNIEGELRKFERFVVFIQYNWYIKLVTAKIVPTIEE